MFAARAWVARHPTCTILEVSCLSEVTWRYNNLNRLFSTVVPLKTFTAANPSVQRPSHPSTPVDPAIFENFSEEYHQCYDEIYPSITRSPAGPRARTALKTNFPLTPLSSATSASGDWPSSFFIPSSRHLHHDDPVTPDLEHSVRVTNQIDTAIFETISDEYLEACHFSSEESQQTSVLQDSTNTAPRKGWMRSHRLMNRSTGLRESVENGEYSRAEILRNELLEAGIQIKRHPIYAEAALRAWESDPVEGRTERFYQWFRLIPHASLGRIRRGRNAVQRVRWRLLAEPTDLNTIACFGLVAARKGYANYISVDILTHIARFASPGVSAAYFSDLEQAALKFYARFGKKTVEASEFSRWDAEKWHNMFIRALCFAGYVDACVDRLTHVLRNRPEVPILPFTWVVLLEMLMQLGRGELVGVVRDLRNTTSRTELTSKNGPSQDPPSATHLANVITEHIEAGRVQDLCDIRQEIMKTSARPDLWAMAQMKFYMDRKQYIVVLKQFSHFYSNVGVPKDVVFSYIQDGSPFLRGKHDKINQLLPIVSPPTHKRGINRWPSSHTIALVWQALVGLAEDLPSVQRLYQSFITYLDQHRPFRFLDDPAVTQEGLSSPIRFQYPPAMSPDTVHFHVFIMGFSRLGGADAALKVLTDMQTRDIQPDVYNWTAIAGQYASQDDRDRAERILTRMESTLVGSKAAPARSSKKDKNTRTREGPVSHGAGWIPAPNLVTYTTILRGLVDRGNFHEAKKLAARIEAAGYITGSDERTDMVLQLLRLRENSPRVSWHVRAQWQP